MTWHLAAQLTAISERCAELGFVMSCDELTGSLLRTLAASKPGGKLLELGTGAGMSAAWLADGMDGTATLLSVEAEPQLTQVAQSVLGADDRVTFVTKDGAEFLRAAQGEQFELIFADTWPGKFECLSEALALLAPGGIYVVDDLNPQPQWPADHAPKVPALREQLRAVPWLAVTELDWSTGLIVAVRESR